MCAPAVPVHHSLDQLHVAFLSILPHIQTHARIYFRHERCPGKKADRISEVVALCWKWFRQLAERGKNAANFAWVLANLAARHVRAGRRLCGQEKSKDVMSTITQQCHGFVVEKLPDYSTLQGSPIEDALQDNTHSAVPDQVCFRLDFPAWIATLNDRDQRIVEALALGHRTSDVARRFGVSAGRVSQLRDEFERDWRQFVGELPVVTKPAVMSA